MVVDAQTAIFVPKHKVERHLRGSPPPRSKINFFFLLYRLEEEEEEEEWKQLHAQRQQAKEKPSGAREINALERS